MEEHDDDGRLLSEDRPTSLLMYSSDTGIKPLEDVLTPLIRAMRPIRVQCEHVTEDGDR